VPDKDDDKVKDFPPNLRIPVPQTLLEKLQLACDELVKEYPPGELAIRVLGYDDTGKNPMYEIKTTRPDIANDIIKKATMRLHGIEPEIELVSVKQDPAPLPQSPKLWTGDESKRRSKPKGKEPNLPD
jgi:hypothetical protein